MFTIKCSTCNFKYSLYFYQKKEKNIYEGLKVSRKTAYTYFVNVPQESFPPLLKSPPLLLSATTHFFLFLRLSEKLYICIRVCVYLYVSTKCYFFQEKFIKYLKTQNFLSFVLI